MTVLPQGERELLEAHKRLNRRRSRLLVGPPSRINSRGNTSRPSERGAHGRRSENRRPVPRITAGIVALVASVAVVFGVAAVFLLGVRNPHAPAHASLSGTGQHVVENGIDQALTRNFKILRRPVRSSDRLPAALAQIARPSAPLNGGPRPTSLGLTPDLAREVTLPGTGLRAWLIPGRHGLCWDAEYAAHELGAFCSSLKNSATALAATNGNDSVRTKTGLLTIGLVTDRVLALELMRPHGQRTRVPISDGFYAGYGISGKNLIAITASGSQILPRASSEIVFDAVGSPPAIGPQRLNEERFSPKLACVHPVEVARPKGSRRSTNRRTATPSRSRSPGSDPSLHTTLTRSGSTTPSTPRDYSASSLHTSGAPGH